MKNQINYEKKSNMESIELKIPILRDHKPHQVIGWLYPEKRGLRVEVGEEAAMTGDQVQEIFGTIGFQILKKIMVKGTERFLIFIIHEFSVTSILKKDDSSLV